jgi:hypothetical protein
VSSIGEVLVIDAAAFWFAVVGSLLFAVIWVGDRISAPVLGALTVGPQVFVSLAALGPHRDFDAAGSVILLVEPPLAIAWWWYVTKRYERADRDDALA